ncbi:hypothetical protein A3F06_01335 [candidate division TM6 bacterium RIFCSPHIGHO2_12_FULL_36_22]|nr:MAG: hypothetical protein A3F06_01335 [candidate division TM6 bacterium RIFCSPHIGHO2_12_FULL_36_22]
MKGKLVTLFVLLGSIGLLQADCRSCNTCCGGKKVKAEMTQERSCSTCDTCCPFGGCCGK